MDGKEGIKEVMWPPNGFLFQEIELSPVMCKPKLIPLKSVTIEKLEKMQTEALEKLKQMQSEQEAEKSQLQEEEANRPKSGGKTDIWQAD